MLLLATAARAEEEPALELRPVVGRAQTELLGEGDTLLDVAYRHRLGFASVKNLNPDVDPWIPPAGTPVRLPTRFVLPRADEEGLVINVPEMRLFDFTQAGGPEVFALAIGDQSDPSILGDFVVGAKRENPTWHVPKSIREEDPGLPAQVPPGPDNPLGSRWMTIGNTSYGLHGTNVRWSIGRLATHGCLRLYEDEVQRLYARVPTGTRIQIVYQPVKWGRDGDRVMIEAHPDLYELEEELPGSALERALELPRRLGIEPWLDPELVRAALEERRGEPVVVGTLPATWKPTSRTSPPPVAPTPRRSERLPRRRRPRPGRSSRPR